MTVWVAVLAYETDEDVRLFRTWEQAHRFVVQQSKSGRTWYVIVRYVE